MFEIDPTSGLIRTSNMSLRGLSGEYSVRIGVTDNSVDRTRLTGDASVTISVLQTNNQAPVWVEPPVVNFTAVVVENVNPNSEPFLQAHAEDDDAGRNGEIRYGFYYLTQFIAQTPEFQIDPINGTITARKSFDREERDSYTLLLVARDLGDPYYESTRYLIVKIDDTNDNIPQFETFTNCCTIPIEIRLNETTAYEPPQLIGTIRADDKDATQLVNYRIQEGNQDEAFDLHSTTGELNLQKQLRYEVKRFYNITIKATDSNNEALTPPLGAHCTCMGELSITRLYIYVDDVNQYPPSWSSSRHTACLSLEADIGSLVTILEAIDPDTNAADNVTFQITDISSENSRDSRDTVSASENSFVIGEFNGSVYSNTLMDRYEDHYFSVEVKAEDIDRKTSDTELLVFVTDPDEEVTLVFDSKPSEVNEHMDAIVDMITELTKGGIVCISDVRFHVTDDNVVRRTWTDLTFHVIGNSTLAIMDPDRVVSILEKDGAFLALFGIRDIYAGGDVWDGFVIDPVVAAIAVILFLLLLLLLLLCCCCLCLGICAKKTKYKPLYIGTINPLWGVKSSEDQELTMRVTEFEGIEPSSKALVSNAADNAGFIGEDELDWRETTQTKSAYWMSQTRSNGDLLGAGGAGGAGGAAGAGSEVVAAAGADPRIEAPLERQSVTSFNSAKMRHRSAATMTDDEMSDVGSAQHNRSGAAGFGATLTRSGVAVERIYGDTGSSLHGSDIVDLTQHNGAGSVSMFPGGGSTSGHVTHVERTHHTSAAPPSLPTQRSYMLESNEFIHDVSAPGEAYSDGGFIAPLDQYQGEINLGTFSTASEPTSRGRKTTYIERREMMEY